MKRTLAALLLLSFPLTALPLGAQLSNPAQLADSGEAEFSRPFQEATELIRRGEWSKAEALLLGLLDTETQLGLVRHNLGISCQRQGRHSQAIEHFQKALEVDATLHNARALMGGSLIALGRIDAGLEELERAASDLPRNIEIRLQLAVVYATLGRRIDEALVWHELAGIQPENPEFAYQLGQTYRGLAEWSTARLMQAGQRSPRFLQSLGQTHLMQGNLEGAAQAFRAAIELDETLLDLHLALAGVLFRQGKLSEALEAVEAELRLMPANLGAQQLKTEIEKQLAGN